MGILRDGLNTLLCFRWTKNTVCVTKQMWSLEARGKTVQFEYEMSHAGAFWKVWFLVAELF